MELRRMELEHLYLRELLLVAIVGEEVDDVSSLAEKPQLLLMRRRYRVCVALCLDLVAELIDALIRVGENVVELEIGQGADRHGDADDRQRGSVKGHPAGLERRYLVVLREDAERDERGHQDRD